MFLSLIFDFWGLENIKKLVVQKTIFLFHHWDFFYKWDDTSKNVSNKILKPINVGFKLSIACPTSEMKILKSTSNELIGIGNCIISD